MEANGRRRQFGIAQHAEIDEQHGARERLEQLMPDRHRNRGLADAPGADDGDKARGGQLSRQPEKVVVAPDHARQAARQIGVWKTGSSRRVRLSGSGPGDRRDEAIAPAGHGGDVARAVRPIAQRLAQAGDMKSQTAFFHRDVGPDPGQQIPFADDLIGPGQQCNQRIKGPGAQFDGLAVPREESFAHDQAERTKRNDVPCLRHRSHRGVFFRSRPGVGSS